MKIRGFEKVKKEQFDKDLGDKDCTYEEIKLPKRATKCSAGYDIYAPYAFKLNPGEMKKVPIGVKAYFREDEVLYFFVRSSTGTKKHVRLCNSVAVFESDYYGNESTDGNIYMCYHNFGSKVWEVNKGEAIAQAVFQKFLTIDEDDATEVRKGGIGSTN